LENENAKVKRVPKGLIYGLSAAVLIIILAVVAWIIYSSSMSYVAKVGGLKVTKQEYTFYSKFNISQFLQEVGKSSSDASKYDWNSKVGSETALETVKKRTLESVQEMKIQLLKAKEAGMKLDKTDLASIDSFINSMVEQAGGKAKAEEQIKSNYGVSLNEYKDIYSEFVLANKYITSEKSKIAISDQDAEKYYNENKKDFDKVTVTHVLISTVDANNNPVTEGKKKEAKKKADDILAKVKAGEDIKELAVKYSEDPGVSTNKGEYTFSKNDSYVQEFKDKAFSLAVGESDIVETSYGYHVMKLEKRVETPFSEQKDSIKSSLQSVKFNADFTKKMEEWKKDPKYTIEKNDRALNSIKIV
jgi:foldase protein PrsA